MKKPEFGKDVEPTEEMIALGRFGNGSYNNDETTMEIVRAERRRMAIERKDNRRNEYESAVIETLGDVADLQATMVKLARKLSLEALNGTRDLSKSDLDAIGKGLKAADQISNRTLGLASRLDDKAATQDALSFLIEGQEVTPEETQESEDE